METSEPTKSMCQYTKQKTKDKLKENQVGVEESMRMEEIFLLPTRQFIWAEESNSSASLS
jgi:hypothetical protein